jgi:hypothetical protein
VLYDRPSDADVLLKLHHRTKLKLAENSLVCVLEKGRPVLGEKQLVEDLSAELLKRFGQFRRDFDEGRFGE